MLISIDQIQEILSVKWFLIIYCYACIYYHLIKIYTAERIRIILTIY